jgi:hypothetical protein
MKNRLLSILFVLLAGTGAVFAQSEVTPPAFNGAVIRVFMTRMAATVEKIAIEQQIPADSISPVVGIALQIDKALNGESLVAHPAVWVEDDGWNGSIRTDVRVGIDYAGAYWKNRPWRWIGTE